MEVVTTSLYQKPHYKGKEIRYIIGHLKEINGLKNSTIYINQEIQIPVI